MRRFVLFVLSAAVLASAASAGVATGVPSAGPSPSGSPVPSPTATATALPTPTLGDGSTPPPTPVPPFGSPSPFITELDTPSPAQHPPEITAASAILQDVDTGQVLYTLHPDDRRAIASTTKILTALTVLRHTNPTDIVTVSEAAAEEGRSGAGFSELGLQEGEELTVRQLLYALLLQSANDAAVALADHVSGSTDRFVDLMNREARYAGLTRTEVYSPNGLDDRGYSTARSLAAMTRRAEREREFAHIVRTKFHTVPPPSDGEPRVIQNRNVLLWLYDGATGVKTGFTTKAGYCLVAAATKGGTRLIAVVLGEPSGGASFDDAAALLDYGFHAFVPREVVEEHQAMGTIDLGGVRVPVQTGAALTSWVPALSTDEATETRDLRPIAGRVEAGDVAGSVQLTLDGLILGSVPLVVVAAPPAQAQTPPRRTVEAVPWWQRGLDTVNDLAGDAFHAVFG